MGKVFTQSSQLDLSTYIKILFKFQLNAVKSNSRNCRNILTTKSFLQLKGPPTHCTQLRLRHSELWQAVRPAALLVTITYSPSKPGPNVYPTEQDHPEVSGIPRGESGTAAVQVSDLVEHSDTQEQHPSQVRNNGKEICQEMPRNRREF